MNAENFVYWLNGFVELTNRTMPSAEQWKMICDHLDLVMEKRTPKGKVDTNKDARPYIPPVLEKPFCSPFPPEGPVFIC